MDNETKAYYDNLLSSMQYSEIEQYNIDCIKAGMDADAKISPFFTKDWAPAFTRLNQDGFKFAEAPLNTFLVVSVETFGTLIRNERGTALGRGSVLVKLTDELIYCSDGWYWYASPSGTANVYSQDGYFRISRDSYSPYGNLKLLSEVVNP